MSRKDINQTAFAVVQQITEGHPPDTRSEYQKAAAEHGRKGGLKGGVARKKALKPTQRSKIAKKGAKARWNQS